MQLRRISFAVATVFLLAAQAPAMAADSGKQTLRPEVGKPLQAAQAALQAKNYAEAKTDIATAEAIDKLTPYERYIIERLKAAAAIGGGDYKTALASYDKVIASPELPAEEKVGILDAYVKLAYTAKDYPRAAAAIEQYKAAGGNDAQTLSLYSQSLYLAGRYKEASAELSREIAAVEQAGQKPTDVQLQLLASSAVKQNDMNAYVAALEKVVSYEPKPEYWLDLTLRTIGKPGYSNRFDLDAYRLRKATGTLDKGSDYADATQLALQAGFPNEAKSFLDEGYARKLLGAGADAARDQRLKMLVDKKIAEDKATLAVGEQAAQKQASGDALVATGFNLVTYGQAEHGLKLMQDGIAKGGLKKPDDAQLHLAYAQILAGQKATAAKTLAGVKGADGARDLAHLWTLELRAGRGS